jgi:hypothetical protein
MSNLTLALDRNEHAIAVDPKDERGKKIFRELVAPAGMTRRSPAELGYTEQQIARLSSDGVTAAAVYVESTGAQG